MLIGLCGFSGSGKDTLANYLVKNHNFVKVSFATILKDILSIIFDWDRDLLEGDTQISREWRETKDEWWTKELGIDVTPRIMMQRWGTELVRKHFHENMWIIVMKRQMTKYQKQNKSIIITDCRFPNEIAMIQNMGGFIIEIQRFNYVWVDKYISLIKSNNNNNDANKWMTENYPDVHSSEYEWLIISSKTDLKINNKESCIKSMETEVESFLQNVKNE